MNPSRLLFAVMISSLATAVVGQTAPMPDPSSFGVGDRWEWRQIDNRTKLEEPGTSSVVVEEKGVREIIFEGLRRPVAYAFVREPSAKPWRVWPLEVGKQWSIDMDYVRADGGSGNLKQDAKVVAYEEVTVPAGKFMAFKIHQDGYVRTSGGFSGRIVDTYWYAPAARADVKHMRRVANQDFTRELVKYPAPAEQQRAAERSTASPAVPGAAAASAVAPPTSSGPDSPAAKRLRELEQLRKDGLISQQEYEEKRKAVLSTL